MALKLIKQVVDEKVEMYYEHIFKCAFNINQMIACLLIFSKQDYCFI
jgi:hypothetical protein